MDPLIHRICAWDGLPLCVREWNGGSARRPVLALPGVVRTAGDFEFLVPHIGNGRRIVGIDYAGRGASGRCRDIARYSPEACVRDIMDVCAALHVHGAIVIGTSFGGLLAMGLGVSRPSLVHAAVLNDIGPEIGSEGAAFVRSFVANDASFADLQSCIAYLRQVLPPMSLDNDEAWRQMAALTYAAGPDSRLHPVWDTRIARLLDAPAPDLWALFGALSHAPLLLVRGAVSTILQADTVERMQAMRPDMRFVALAGIGHAPILTEPEALAALTSFLDEVE